MASNVPVKKLPSSTYQWPVSGFPPFSITFLSPGFLQYVTVDPQNINRMNHHRWWWILLRFYHWWANCSFLQTRLYALHMVLEKKNEFITILEYLPDVCQIIFIPHLPSLWKCFNPSSSHLESIFGQVVLKNSGLIRITNPLSCDYLVVMYLTLSFNLFCIIIS